MTRRRPLWAVRVSIPPVFCGDDEMPPWLAMYHLVVWQFFTDSDEMVCNIAPYLGRN